MFSLSPIFKKRTILSMLLISAFVLAACTQVQGVVQKVVVLPDALQNAITALSIFVVGWLFAQIVTRLPWFVKLFGQYADEIAFALSGALITYVQSLLAMIPPSWEGAGNAFLMFLVSVLAAIQLFKLLGKAGVKSFRA